MVQVIDSPGATRVRVATEIPQETLVLVQQAADRAGQSLSDFFATAIGHAARQALDDQAGISLLPEAEQAFVALLLNPGVLSPAMERARDRHERLIGPL